MAHTGVILLYMGGPETVADVKPFLRQLFSDRDLIQLPGGRLLQRPFALLISTLRAPKVEGYYEEIGGGSPLVPTTRAQAAALHQRLGDDFVVEIALRYCAPRAAEAVARLRERGVERVVALPLYPHYSGATTGSSLKDLQGALSPGEREGLITVADFHDHEGYIQAVAGTVREALEDDGDHGCLVFSAHSLPVRMIEQGDPYQRQVEATVARIVEAVGPRRWELGYQSRSGPVQWLEPDVVDLVDRLIDAGEKRLVLVPISFVSDHIETLHEIDIRLRQQCLDRGAEAFVRARSLNEDPVFIEALADIVRKAVAARGSQTYDCLR